MNTISISQNHGIYMYDWTQRQCIDMEVSIFKYNFDTHIKSVSYN